MTKLAEPFPLNPIKGTNFHIYAMRHFPGETSKRVFTLSFHSCYAAKRWLEIMMGDEEATRRGHELFLGTTGIKLRTFELDSILSYEYASSAEANWRLPDVHMLTIARFRRGTWFPEVKVIEAAVKASPDIKTKTVTTTKAVMPSDYIKVTELCKGTSVKPTDARAILRAMMPKPEYGWAFAPNRVKEIRKMIGV